MAIYHVTKVPLEKSSRVLSQLNIFPDNSHVIELRNLRETLKYLSVLRGETIIFHQQASLVCMLLFIFFNFINKRENRIIYDMHDLVIFDYSGLFRRVRACLIYVLEFIVTKFDFKIITVSNGLAKTIKKRYGRDACVVYNFPSDYKENNFSLDSACSENKKICYFGIIDEKRIPVKLFKEVSELNGGGNIDVYGYISPVSNFSFSGVEFLSYKGEFKPNNMSFLNNYNVLVFVTDQELNLNYKYCMPNKIFQALTYGMDILVSDFFEEIVETFSEAKEENNMFDSINGVKYLRADKMSKKLDQLFIQSKSNFISVILGENANATTG
ncbi:hypothetical protein [Acinetobacter sp. NIPH 2699]|uniref:hypothetical protein n=1 Tax=Acinetobacter sp. NIPH 2699 TaxID=2923433 RepID=UPI001F4B9E01|nr:hypothetical protein [Acinetobacter sp. NIPH 2699]MCH7337297.1 hypothetical protein [Acinetobacter sp. NIPH 2699]